MPLASFEMLLTLNLFHIISLCSAAFNLSIMSWRYAFIVAFVCAIVSSLLPLMLTVAVTHDCERCLSGGCFSGPLVFLLMLTTYACPSPATSAPGRAPSLSS